MRILFIVALSFVLLAVGVREVSKAQTFMLFGETITRVEISRPMVALTLDDGPSSGNTAIVLDTLAREDVHLTFFLNGKHIEQSPDAAKAIIDAGHEIGNHGWSHNAMMFRSPRWVRSELYRTDQIIRGMGYEGPILFRPPFGRKLVVLPWVLAQENRPAMMWSVEPEDWSLGPDDPQQSAQDMVDRAVSQAQAGDIIIMHVMWGSRGPSREALGPMIRGLKAKGLEVVTLSELLDAAS